MNPFQLAERLYKEHATRDLREDILLWSASDKGIVISTHEFFILVTIPENYSHMYEVYCLTGDLKAAVKHLVNALPYRPFVTYQRFGKQVVISTPTLLNKLRIDVPPLCV